MWQRVSCDARRIVERVEQRELVLDELVNLWPNPFWIVSHRVPTRWGEGEVSAESIGKTAFLGVAWPRDAKLISPGAAGSLHGPNRGKTLLTEAV